MTHSFSTIEPDKMYGMLAQAEMVTSISTIYFTYKYSTLTTQVNTMFLGCQPSVMHIIMF